MMWKLSTENSNFLFIRSTNFSSTELVLLLPSAIRLHLSLSFTFTILDTYASFNVQEDIRFFEVCSGKRSSNESKTACFTCKVVGVRMIAFPSPLHLPFHSASVWADPL